MERDSHIIPQPDDHSDMRKACERHSSMDHPKRSGPIGTYEQGAVTF